MSYLDAARMILPDPLWIVADDRLAELEWALRSEPLPHLAIGMGLVEELRAVHKTMTNYELGKLLGMEWENGMNRSDWCGGPYTYGDVKRSNYPMWGGK